MENTLFHSLFLQAFSRSVSPCCSHGGVAFFYIQAQFLTDPHLGALNKQKKREIAFLQRKRFSLLPSSRALASRLTASSTP